MALIYFPSQNKSKEIPVGWNELKEGEKISKEHKFLQFFGWVWKDCRGLIGEVYSKSDSYRVICKNKEKIIYTKEQKNNLIKKLKENKAFNEDCAFKFLDENDYELADAMVEKEEIGKYKEKYFIFET